MEKQSLYTSVSMFETPPLWATASSLQFLFGFALLRCMLYLFFASAHIVYLNSCPRISVAIFAEGVGKSSLISTFVSRHFSEHIPKLLTRVHIPPDPLLSRCSATLVDTTDGDSALQNVLSLSQENIGNSLASATTSDNDDPASTVQQSAGSLLASTVFRNVDAMVLVYDLSREETFHRLEDNWLPLIERCYKGKIPVIVAGNKSDLVYEQDSNQSMDARSRQQIISLLQRFKFVRQVIKCSARDVLHIDDVFNEAKLAVLYPIKPLYDLDEGKLSHTCLRAFTRIFRMFSRDGLLGDDELLVFQKKIWGPTQTGRDVIDEWKRALVHHDTMLRDASIESEDVIVGDKITLTGFITLIDMFISQNSLELPWKILRKLGYDDDLNLHLPDNILPPGCDDLDQTTFDVASWKLNASEVDFLSSIFYQFKSDGERMLSSDDLNCIFSVFSIPLPPWSVRSQKLLHGCFSLPRIEDDVTPPSSLVADVTFDTDIEEQLIDDPSPPSPSLSPSGVTISSSPLPSINVSKSTELDFPMPILKPLNYLSWMNHWHMFCTISPSRCRADLLGLGYAEDMRTTSILSPPAIPGDSTQTIFIRALVLGNNDKAKRSVVNNLHGVFQEDVVLSSTYPETSCSVSRVTLPTYLSKSVEKETEKIVQLILTEVPSSYLTSSASEKMELRRKLNTLLGKQGDACGRVYDVAMLVFEAGNEESWQYVKDVERTMLDSNTPRMFVGTKEHEHDSPVMDAYQSHCKSMDVENPMIVPLEENMMESGLLCHLVRCKEDKSFRSIPHGERKRRLATIRRKALWFSSLTLTSFVVVFIYKETKKAERGSWLQYFRRLLPFNY